MAREITLNHIAKIEGHAHLDLKIEKNKVIECKLKAAEGARFFEALVVGKHVEDVQEIVSRICGICSSSHTVASILGLEEALKIKPTAQQTFIREMLMLGERIRSHATHLYFLSLPDYFGAESVLDLGPEHRGKIDDALKMITVGNKIVETFGGREMHPFLKVKEELGEFDTDGLLKSLGGIKSVVRKTIDLFAGIDYLKIERDADYLCLHEGRVYANISGKIVSNTGKFEDDDYKKHLEENVKEYATSKFVLKNGKPYMLGAQARVNNNHVQLDHETKGVLMEVMDKLKLNFPLNDPHYNLICQAIEILQAVNRTIALIEKAPKKEDVKKVLIRAGKGVSSVEAPRGTLFHEYILDKDGKVTYCNIITPTAQNLNMMEADIVRLVDLLLEEGGHSKKDIVSGVEKLIRAYDPCFSCSTHFLTVDWNNF
jgi:sulfhydrogenase subunit alpha